MTARWAILGHVLYIISCIVTADLVAIMILEAVALFDGHVTDFQKFFDPFAPFESVDFPTMPQAFALAIGSWLFALLCRRCLIGEKDRELYLSAKEIETELPNPVAERGWDQS